MWFYCSNMEKWGCVGAGSRGCASWFIGWEPAMARLTALCCLCDGSGRSNIFMLL